MRSCRINPGAGVLFLLLLGTSLHSQWENHISNSLQDEIFKGAQVALSVMDLSGNSILDSNEDVLMIPASSYKLIPSLTAYSIMGREFRFETRVVHTGEILSDGTLYGDIVIIGSGDPSLGSDKTPGALGRMELVAMIVKSILDKGISCIDGMIRVDATIFDVFAVHDSWHWDDLSNYYASGTFGLNVSENAYRIFFSRSNSPGRPTHIEKTDPEMPLLTLDNLVMTGEKGSGDNAYIYGSPYGYHKQIRGTIPPGENLFSIRGAIPDPAKFLVEEIKKGLLGSGVSTKESRNYDLDHLNNYEPLVSLQSPGLEALVQTALFESNNLYCDSFMKRIGAEISPPGSYPSGAAAIADHLESLGISVEGISLKDGSGLSMKNRVSARFLNAVLVEKSKELGVETLLRLLPQVGVEGSVKYFMSSSPSRMSFWLKSGSMEGVLSYTGLMKGQNGKYLAITFMSNGHASDNGAMRKKVAELFDTIFQGYNG